MYVVMEYTPGYLPENEPVQFETLADAQPYLEELHAELKEEGYVVMDTGTNGWYEFMYYQKDENDLGRMVVCERGEE